MINSETVLVMTVQTHRAYVGTLIREEISRRGLTVARAAEACGLGIATMNRIMHKPDYPITPIRQRGIEGGFDWPRHLIEHLLVGDSRWIEQLPVKSVSDPGGIDADLRRHVLESLKQISAPTERRRAR